MQIRSLMNHIANPVMKRLLRSPLHRMLSFRILLITVTGRKSGKQYTTPVEYLQQGDTITILSSESYSWWKNLRGGGTAALVLRGQHLTAAATTNTDPAVLQAALRQLYPRMTPAQIERFAQGRVVIQLRLQPAAEAVPV